MTSGSAAANAESGASGEASAVRGAPGRRPVDARTQGLVALAFVQVCFGLFPVFGRLAMDEATGFSPFAVATWRILVGAVALAIIAALVHGRDALPKRRSDWGLLAVYALLAIVLNQGLFHVGLSRSTPMNAGLVICLIPVLTYVVAALGKREPFQATRALGVAIALAGAVPLFLSRGADLSSSYAFGNFLMAMNALCYAVYLVYSKSLLERMPPLALVAWIYVLSLPWLAAFAIGEDLAPAAATRGAWWSLAYVLVFPTVVAYALNSYALARVRASTTAFFVFTQPLITAAGAWFVLSERPTPALGVAAVLIFCGMALVVRRPRP